MSNKILDYARPIIVQYEGLRLTPYKCPAGVLTVGYGHTGRDIKEDESISLEQANLLLDIDMQNTLFQLKRVIKVDLSDSQMGALVSLVFNIGIGAFKKSKTATLINAGGDIKEVEREWLGFSKGGGVVLPGLVKRRKDEIALFKS